MADRPLTPKQEKFAQLYVELGNASEAYKGAYPKAKRWSSDALRSQASKSLSNPNIRTRVDELRAAVAERAEVTIESLVDELEEARKVALTDPRAAGAAVSASMGKGKLLGFVVDKQKVEATVTLQQLPPLSAVAAGELKSRLEAERF